MISLKIRGIRVDIRFSFLLFNALIFLVRERQVILCFYGGCVLHELGHILAAAIAGIRMEKIVLNGTGIIMIAERKAAVPLRYSLFVLLSGPAVNLAFAGITELWSGSRIFVILNLALCLYNLLPFPGLDGGAALELLISGTPCEYSARKLIAAVRYGMLLAAAAAVFRGIREFFPVFTVLLFLNAGIMVKKQKKCKNTVDKQKNV